MRVIRGAAAALLGVGALALCAPAAASDDGPGAHGPSYGPSPGNDLRHRESAGSRSASDGDGDGSGGGGRADDYRDGGGSRGRGGTDGHERGSGRGTPGSTGGTSGNGGEGRPWEEGGGSHGGGSGGESRPPEGSGGSRGDPGGDGGRSGSWDRGRGGSRTWDGGGGSHRDTGARGGAGDENRPPDTGREGRAPDGGDGSPRKGTFGFAVQPSSVVPGGQITLRIERGRDGCREAATVSSGVFDTVPLPPGRSSDSAQIDPDARPGAVYQVTFVCDGGTRSADLRIVGADGEGGGPEPLQRGVQAGEGGTLAGYDLGEVGMGTALVGGAIGAAYYLSRRRADPDGA